MAVAFGSSIGTVAKAHAAGATSDTLTTTAAVPSSSLIVVCVSWWNASANPMSSMTDGSAYTLAKRNIGGTDQLEIWYRYAAAGLASAATITLNWAGVWGGGLLIGAMYFTGTTATPLDSASGSAASSGTSWTSGAATATGADSVYVGASGAEAVATSVGGSMSSGTKVHDLYDAAEQQGMQTGYKIRASIASDSIGGTFASSSTNSVGALAIFLASGGGASADPGPLKTFNAIPFMGGGL